MQQPVPGLHGPDPCVQAAFMPGGLVGMDQFFAYRRVDAGQGLFVSGFGSRLVPRMDGFDHRFYSGTQFCTLTYIMQTIFHRLACTFSC